MKTASIKLNLLAIIVQLHRTNQANMLGKQKLINSHSGGLARGFQIEVTCMCVPTLWDFPYPHEMRLVGGLDKCRAAKGNK